MDQTVEAIHAFWFGDLDKDGLCEPSQHDLWFRKSDDTDRLCREQFGDAVQQALAGELDHWRESEPGLVALLLLLDQFTRNIYRDTPAAFSGDRRARNLAVEAIDSGAEAGLPPIHRVFVYLPLEHSENAADQARCVTLFHALAEATGTQQFHDFARYADAHKEVIDRFGRFPHRNAILGRESTAAEQAYLEKHGGF